MTTNSIEKRVNTLEGRQPQHDFVPARWLTREEGDKEMDEQYRKEEENQIDVLEQEEQQRARGTPEWMILIERENRAEYYERKNKKQ